MGALLTFYGMGLGVVGYAASTLALVMLFSGGTFLFVATVHILSEVMSGDEPLSWADVRSVVVRMCALVCGKLVGCYGAGPPPPPFHILFFALFIPGHSQPCPIPDPVHGGHADINSGCGRAVSHLH